MGSTELGDYGRRQEPAEKTPPVFPMGREGKSFHENKKNETLFAAVSDDAAGAGISDRK